jgi:membrane-associated phospholipid phosphatase
MNERKKNLVVSIAVASVAVISLFAVDVQIWVFLRNQISPDVISFLKLLSKRGLYFFYAIFAGLIGYSFFKKNSRLKTICLDYLKTQLIFSFGVVRCMKILFGRARPDYGTEFTFFSLDAHYNSFPSGHSADAFVSGVFLFYLLKNSKHKAYRFLPLGYALVMAVLRIVVSAHYPSDVIAGMAIGILGAYFVLTSRFCISYYSGN